MSVYYVNSVELYITFDVIFFADYAGHENHVQMTRSMVRREKIKLFTYHMTCGIFFFKFLCKEADYEWIKFLKCKIIAPIETLWIDGYFSTKKTCIVHVNHKKLNSFCLIIMK